METLCPIIQWGNETFSGKNKRCTKAVSAMCKHWKRHGAEEAIGANLFGAAYAIFHLWLNSKTWKATAKPTIN